MKLGRLNHIGVATQSIPFVIARSVATWQSRATLRNTGLLRFARNDELGKFIMTGWGVVL
jgi:hypothetical protein